MKKISIKKNLPTLELTLLEHLNNVIFYLGIDKRC